MRGLRHFAGLILASVLTGRSAAQTPAVADSATTAADVARHISVIADDSMMGRHTPSPGLEKMARYVAEQFERLGLAPGGTPSSSNGRSWFQRYPVAGQLSIDYSATWLVFKTQVMLKKAGVVGEQGWPIQRRDSIGFGSAARLIVDTLSEPRGYGFMGMQPRPPLRTFLVTGPHTPETVRRARPENAIAIYVPPPGTDSARQQQIADLLLASNHVIVLPEEDSVTFERRREAASKRPVAVIDDYMQPMVNRPYWAVSARAEAVERLLSRAGLDVAQARATVTPLVRQLGGVSAELAPLVEELVDPVTAPNVIGVIDGSDVAYRHQSVVFVAHMDHRGANDGRADGIPDGADDNASGVAGLIALAKAFTRPGAPRPRRTVIFLAVSGHEQNFAGANYFMNALPEREGQGPIAVAINLDMLGRKAGDSVRVAGLQDLELAARPDWLAAKHGHLGVTVVDDGTVAVPSSDHFSFVLKAVPSLYFYRGTHDDPRALRDLPDAIDAGQEARLLQLIYYMGLELANAGQRPRWSAAGRRQRLLMVGR